MNSKRKGKTGELEFSRLCRSEGYDTQRGQQYKGSPDSPDVEGLPGIHIEVKRVERLNIQEAIDQAERDKGTEDMPIVAYRRNHCPWPVTMKAADWFKLYREWEAGGNNLGTKRSQ